MRISGQYHLEYKTPGRTKSGIAIARDSKNLQRTCRYRYVVVYWAEFWLFSPKTSQDWPDGREISRSICMHPNQKHLQQFKLYFYATSNMLRSYPSGPSYKIMVSTENRGFVIYNSFLAWTRISDRGIDTLEVIILIICQVTTLERGRVHWVCDGRGVALYCNTSQTSLQYNIIIFSLNISRLLACCCGRWGE